MVLLRLHVRGPSAASPRRGVTVGACVLPLTVPAHALTLLALGLLIGQQRQRRQLLPVAAFVAGLAAGLTAIALAVGQIAAASIVLIAAALSGILVAVGHPLPALVCAPLAAVAGVALGLDSPPEAISIAVGTAMLIGTGLGASLAVAIIVLGSSRVVRASHGVGARTGVRILGSWIAASAILVLTLRFARGQLF